MDDLVEVVLQVIEVYFELIMKDVVFQKIIRDIVGVLQVLKLDILDLFLEMVRLVFLYSVDYVELIMDVKFMGFRYILVIVIEECLCVIMVKFK